MNNKILLTYLLIIKHLIWFSKMEFQKALTIELGCCLQTQKSPRQTDYERLVEWSFKNHYPVTNEQLFSNQTTSSITPSHSDSGPVMYPSRPVQSSLVFLNPFRPYNNDRNPSFCIYGDIKQRYRDLQLIFARTVKFSE